MIASLLTLANLVFFYIKTRPKPPDVILEQSLVSVRLEKPDSIVPSVYLDKDHQWRSRDGTSVKLPRTVWPVFGNIDGPSHWILVEQGKRWTLPDVLLTIRSAARDGVCNLVIVDREMGNHNNPKDERPDLPVLTVAEYSPKAGEPLQRCVSDPIIAKRYLEAEKDYRRGVRSSAHDSNFSF